mgnify:FL=1
MPLVMLEEVPIPSEAKERDTNEQVLSTDTAFSTWFVGSEGWQSDAMSQGLSHRKMRAARESYFSAQFETVFYSIIAFNYEAAIMRGHWVRMVSKDLPAINRDAVLETELVTPPSEEKQP